MSKQEQAVSTVGLWPMLDSAAAAGPHAAISPRTRTTARDRLSYTWKNEPRYGTTGGGEIGTRRATSSRWMQLLLLTSISREPTVRMRLLKPH